MAWILRKLFTKEQPVANRQTDTQREVSSPPALTSAKFTSRNKNESDTTTTLSLPSPPVPELKLRAHAQSPSRNISPTQALLDRYKQRTPTSQITTESPFKAQPVSAQQKTMKASTSSEGSERMPPTAAEDAINEPMTHDQALSNITRMFDGIEFEMMRAQKPNQPPSNTPIDKANAPAKKLTRSQTKSEHGDSTKMGGEAGDADPPRALTIRKVKGPNELRNGGSDSLEAKTASVYTSRNDADTASVAGAEVRGLTGDQGHPPSSPAPSDSRPLPTKISSYRRARLEQSSRNNVLPTPVNPPPCNLKIPPGYVWVSPLGSSSRPSEPWGWNKKWTCCQCASRDPAGKGRPVQTMVEQKSCARLGCGHERCATGCKMLRDAQYDVRRPFPH